MGMRDQANAAPCGQSMQIEQRPWHIHHRIWWSKGGGEGDNLELMHANCHRQIHAAERK